MDTTWTVCTDGWEQVPPAETNKRVLHLAAVAGKEDGAGSRSIANTQHIALLDCGTKRGYCKRIIVRFVTVGVIGDRKSTQTRHTERRVRFCRQTDGN